MEEIINKLIKYHIKGVDTYTHNGSTWLIFTKTKQWVIELTDSKTLWYNYNFFSTIFSYASLSVIDDQQYITKWVEDNVINGVKETSHNATMFQSMKVEDTLENGVKETQFNWYENKSWVEGVIKEGVKETLNTEYMPQIMVEDTIENGVKQTLPGGKYINDVEEVIKDGVKSSHPLQYKSEEIIDEVVNDGIKETHDDTYHHKGRIDGVIKNGINHTQPHVIKNKYIVEEVIEDGVKSSHPLQYISKEIIGGIIETHDDAYHHKGRIDGVIKNGVKEIKNPTG
jgi:hypothetical protein